MSPSKSEREREYARRRQEKFRAKQADKEASRARRARQNVIAGVLAVLLVAGAVVVTVVLGGDDGDQVATPVLTEPETAQPTATDVPTQEAPAVENPCPEPPAPPAEPLQFDAPPAAGTVTGQVEVAMETSCGQITLQLDADAAPAAVASFTFLADEGFFTDVPCHRLVTAGIFVLQCGDPTGTGSGGPGYEFGPVENAPADDVYPAGTIAMARVGENGESMGSQFFLVYEDSPIPSDSAGGYTVMGTITGGLDVVQTIASGGATDQAPNFPISLTEVRTEAAP